jgi:hypothetical protein
MGPLPGVELSGVEAAGVLAAGVEAAGVLVLVLGVEVFPLPQATRARHIARARISASVFFIVVPPFHFIYRSVNCKGYPMHRLL